MSIFNDVVFTIQERCERNLPLSDILCIVDIALLWGSTNKEQKIFIEAMHSAYEKETLKGKEVPQNDNDIFIAPYNECYYIYILVDDFLVWLKSNNEPLPKDCLLANWWHEYKPQALEEVLEDSVEITELRNKQADKATIGHSTAIFSLNKTEGLLGSADDTQVRATTDTQLENKNRKSSRKTQINIFLTGICETQEIDKLSAETLVRAIKPLIDTANCPVERYHGFHGEVCINWKAGTGSTSCSWGKKSFQNFVSGFKKEQALKSLSSSNIK